jgi:hypothetical protein
MMGVTFLFSPYDDLPLFSETGNCGAILIATITHKNVHDFWTEKFRQ